MTNSWCRIGLLSLSVAVAAGCQNHSAKPAGENSVAMDRSGMPTPGDPGNKSMTPIMRKMAVATITASKASAVNDNKNVAGKVTFTDMGGKVLIVADISGLVPNSKHGFHIHQNADLSGADLKTAGDHFDPGETHKHGDPMTHGMANMIHAGDMGNLVANDKGMAHLEMTVTDLSIDSSKTGVIGHSVIIHAMPDDLVTSPSGNSGARIAGGVIESAKE